MKEIEIIERLTVLFRSPSLPGFCADRMTQCLLDELKVMDNITEVSAAVLLGIAAQLMRFSVAMQVESAISRAKGNALQ